MEGLESEVCCQVLEATECHMKDTREIALGCAMLGNCFGPCHQSTCTGVLIAPNAYLRL